MMHVVMICDEHSADRPAGTLPKASDYKARCYPHSEIEVRTHADPKFIIFEAGCRLQELACSTPYLEKTYAGSTYPELVAMLREIYLAWSRPVPETHITDRSYEPPTEPSPPDDSSIRTGGARARRDRIR